MFLTLPAHKLRALWHWLLSLPLVALGLLALVGIQADAVANRFTQKLGLVGGESIGGGPLNVTRLLNKVLEPAEGAGSRELKALIFALIALVVLGGIVYFVLAMIKLMGGKRGGLEGVGQVVVAFIVGIAVLEVLA